MIRAETGELEPNLSHLSPHIHQRKVTCSALRSKGIMSFYNEYAIIIDMTLHVARQDYVGSFFAVRGAFLLASEREEEKRERETAVIMRLIWPEPPVKLKLFHSTT